ncbi:hypothetical protein HanXRQr2_Chr10g0438021 [Helianthus annuus]|uniref:Uncharacterized protein n=1 Tax=Helianthus annuus TaxID=4232 RepID=A0A9K3N407_HELAN|nr:hypothetical protein HanXRQr2_Chr10g0438021 [Helianthus annuus]
MCVEDDDLRCGLPRSRGGLYADGLNHWRPNDRQPAGGSSGFAGFRQRRRSRDQMWG